MSRNRIIIVAILVVVIAAVVLVLTGVIPGLRKREETKEVKLTLWGVFDKQSSIEQLISAYKDRRSNVSISYRELSPDTYEADLLNALAAGRGPDVFMFHNTWLPKHFNKVAPLTEAELKLTDFQNMFPTVAEQDFAPAGTIYALPLYIDTMALLYNKDIFDHKAIALTPRNWRDVQDAIAKIKEMDSKGQIKLAGAAIGGSDKSVNRASDLLSLLMLQSGVKMTDREFSRATFAGDGIKSLDFYTQFSDPKNKNYTWNDDTTYSLDAFAQGSVAMIFNYQYNIRAIREKNPFLRVGITDMPQPGTAGARVDYPNYYGLTVSATSREPGYAWDFVKFATTNSAVNQKYLKAAKHPPALRTLIAKYQDDPDYGVFARQALSARSWPQIDNVAVDQAFSDMISDVLTGRSPKDRAIREAEDKISGLMARRR